MMLTNATITIYNHKYDSLTHFDTWHRTVIENVHIYVNHKATAGDSGLNSAEVYKIRILPMWRMRISIFHRKNMKN